MSFERTKTRDGFALADYESQPDGSAKRKLAGYLKRSGSRWSLRLFPTQGAADQIAASLPAIPYAGNQYAFVNLSEHRTIREAEEHAEIARALFPAFKWEAATLTDSPGLVEVLESPDLRRERLRAERSDQESRS